MNNGHPEVIFISLEQLFQRVNEVCEKEDAVNLINLMMKWELNSNENLLMILCDQGMQ
jgi:hypothetical protein